MSKRGPATPNRLSFGWLTKTVKPMSRVRSNTQRGFTLLETMIVVGLIGVISAIAVPMFGNVLAFFRVSGDARSTSNEIALSKMRAAAVFSKVRLYVDLTGKSHHQETFDKTNETCCWVASGGTTYLSQGVTFGRGVVSVAPPSTTQPAIAQALPCKANATPPTPPADIANTACVIFNSRGTPVDPGGSAGVVDTVYVTDGSVVYGIAVSATGMIRSWKTPATSTPKWVLQ